MVEFPADLPPLYVSEMAETLPTCVCYRHEELGKFFWSVPFMFDSVVQAMGDDGNALELQKFNRSIQKFVGQNSVKSELGDHAFYFKDHSR